MLNAKKRYQVTYVAGDRKIPLYVPRTAAELPKLRARAAELGYTMQVAQA